MAKIPVVCVQDKTTIALIEEGHKASTAFKDAEERLRGIKTELEYLDAGSSYKTPSGKSVTISNSPVYSAIDPAEAKVALRAKRLGRNFLACVKVNVAFIQRHLSDQEMDTLREVVTHTRKHSFRG